MRELTLTYSFYYSFVLAIIFPIGSFINTVHTIENLFPDNCDLASKKSRNELEKQEIFYVKNYVGKIFGTTPNVYYLSTIGICEYKKGNLIQAEKALETLLDSKEINISENFDAKKYRDLLEKIKNEIHNQ